MIKVGDRLPEATFRVMTEKGPEPRTTAEIFGGKKVVLFGVPGAFTPTCHQNHLPGYLANAEALKAKGVDEIAVTAVNDPFVMKAWAESTGGMGKITYLSDGAPNSRRPPGWRSISPRAASACATSASRCWSTTEWSRR